MSNEPWQSPTPKPGPPRCWRCRRWWRWHPVYGSHLVWACSLGTYSDRTGSIVPSLQTCWWDTMHLKSIKTFVPETNLLLPETNPTNPALFPTDTLMVPGVTLQSYLRLVIFVLWDNWANCQHFQEERVLFRMSLNVWSLRQSVLSTNLEFSVDVLSIR